MKARPGKRRLRFILPGLYVLLAVYVWWDFIRLPRDGLANMGLMFITAPVTLVGLILDEVSDSSGFSLMPGGHGYLTNHSLYYVPAVAVTALLFWLLGRKLDCR